MRLTVGTPIPRPESGQEKYSILKILLLSFTRFPQTHAETPVPTDFTHFLISSTLNLVHFGLRRTG